MSIERKVEQVEELFFKLEQEISLFQKSSQISCAAGCGKCCTFPNIEASPLEFLPWAFHLFLIGEAEKTIRSLSKTTNSTCLIYTPLLAIHKGSCNSYKYRGLICRLFGFAANSDKYGNLRLATCKIIKESQTANYNLTTKAISNGLYVPVFTDYYMQLNQIDFNLGNLIVPVNKALKMALEEVINYYAYRPVPDIEKRCS